MTELVDLVSATRGAVFRALKADVSPDLCAVFSDIPAGTLPNFLKIGSVDNENDESKGDQFEKITVELIGVYRGGDSSVLTAMMFAGRMALDRRQFPDAGGAQFLKCRFIAGSQSDASKEDGVTYAGIANFEIWAEPA